MVSKLRKNLSLRGKPSDLCSEPDELGHAVDELKAKAKAGQRVCSRVLDVSKPSDVDITVSIVTELIGGCDILVNNAGIYGPKGTIETVDWEDWKKAIEINLYGSILMTRALLPLFKSQGAGKIIQLSGGGATNPLPRLSAYAASQLPS